VIQTNIKKGLRQLIHKNNKKGKSESQEGRNERDSLNLSVLSREIRNTPLIKLK
jgi:hypothetical protein